MSTQAITEKAKPTVNSGVNALNKATEATKQKTGEIASVFAADKTATIGIASVACSSIFAGATAVASTLVKNPTAQKVLKATGLAGMAIALGAAVGTALYAIFSKNEQQKANNAEMAAQQQAHDAKMQAKDDAHNKAMQAKDKEHAEKMQAKDDAHNKAMQAKDKEHAEKMQAKDALFEKNIDKLVPIIKAKNAAKNAQNAANVNIGYYDMLLENHKNSIRIQVENKSGLEKDKLTGFEEFKDEVKTEFANLKAETKRSFWNKLFGDKPTPQKSHNQKINEEMNAIQKEINLDVKMHNIHSAQQEEQIENLNEANKKYQAAEEKIDALTNPDKQKKEDKTTKAA